MIFTSLHKTVNHMDVRRDNTNSQFSRPDSNLKGYFVLVNVLNYFIKSNLSSTFTVIFHDCCTCLCVSPLDCSVSGFQASEAHVLDFQVLVDAVLGALSAQTGLFDPTEGSLRCGQEALVDSNYPHLQCLCHPPDLTHILRVKVA